MGDYSTEASALFIQQASDFVFDPYDYYKWNEYYDEESYDEENYENPFATRITSNEEDFGVVSSTLVKSKSETPFVNRQSRWKRDRDRDAAIREHETRERLRKFKGTKLGKGLDNESIKTVLTYEDKDEEDIPNEKETSSEDSVHVCLKIIDTSDSGLEISKIYDDLTIEEDSKLPAAESSINTTLASYGNDGIQKFFDLAKKMKLRPINSMREMMLTDTLNLRYYGIDPRIVEPICEALSRNTTVRNIDLTDNWLTAKACSHLKELLITNDVITSLDLSGCRIGADGAKNLHEGISAATKLTCLNLSRCEIGDDGLQYIATAVYLNNVLENLILADCKLRENSGEFLSKMLTQTDSLRRLDLSWNCLWDGKFADIFFQGLSKNSSLEYLNMSGNGLGEDTVKFLSSYLTINSQSLREFDLSGNRFTAIEASQIGKALTNNTGLEILRLADNPLNATGALSLVNALTPEKSPNLRLKLLDLDNIWANKDIIPSLKIIQRDRSWLNVKLAGIIGNYKLLEPDTKMIFLRRANFEAMNPKKIKQRRDFGQFVINLKDEVVSTEIFKDSVKKFKLKLTDSLVDEIAKAFEIEKGQIDLASLKELYLKEYPETQPLPPESEKKSKKKKEKSMKKKKEN